MENNELCAICGEGHVTAQVRSVETEYKSTRALLPVHYQQCDFCTSDYVGMAESKLNKRIVMAFRKQVDGLLTGNEITALRKHYHLTQAQAAKLFGGGPVAFSKYENDDVAQSEAMDTLLRLVRRSPEAFWALVEEKHLEDEFTQQRTPVRTGAKVMPLTTAVRTEVKQNPHYDPRPFRRFAEGAVTCQN
jgi:HTH-type transcriptional regulator / antitoxin MqsA